MCSSPFSAPPSVLPSWRIGIIHSSYYKEETGQLVSGAVETLRRAGILDSHVQIFPVPGSFEIPLMGAMLAEAGVVDGLIGLGIIVQGETHHARLLAEQAARGIMEVQLQYRLPFAFEVLFVDSLAVARARLSKGEEAARTVLHMLAISHKP